MNLKQRKKLTATNSLLNWGNFNSKVGGEFK